MKKFICLLAVSTAFSMVTYGSSEEGLLTDGHNQVSVVSTQKSNDTYSPGQYKFARHLYPDTAPNTGVASEEYGQPIYPAEKTAISLSLIQRLSVQLDKSYGNEENFRRYGILFEKGGLLHVGIKSEEQRREVIMHLQNAGDPDLLQYVVVEPAKYSRDEYDVIANDAINFFIGMEGPGKIITTINDPINSKLILVVYSINPETKRAFSDYFKDVVSISVAENSSTAIATVTPATPNQSYIYSNDGSFPQKPSRRPIYQQRRQ